MGQFADLRFAYPIFWRFMDLRFGTNYFLRMINFRKSANTILVNFRVAIGGLGQQGSLRIFDLRINRYECADLQFAYSHTSIFAYLRLRNEPKNLCLCDLWTNKEKCVRAAFGRSTKHQGPYKPLFKL
jgi:hypothetical protein